MHNVLDDSCIVPLLPNYIWSDESPAKFEIAMRSDEIKQRLEKLSNCNIDGSTDSINGAAAELTNILISAADKSLKRPKIGKKEKATLKWYNKDLSLLRKNLMKYGKVYFKYPKDPQIKIHYNKLFREYNKLMKLRQREYKQ